MCVGVSSPPKLLKHLTQCEAMGIKKLHAFMINESACFEVVRLKECKAVVIDGYCLCYCLHSGIAGSNYYQFYMRVIEYFRKIKLEGVEMYLVLDGTDLEKKKLKTKENRCQTRLEQLAEVNSRVELLPSTRPVLPLMAKIVFVDAIRDLSAEGVLKFFVADAEADREVVSLANHLGCPVLGKDSDYYIFNINGGYIPIVDDEHQLIDLTDKLPCFKYRLFDSKYCLSSPHVRLLLPFCLGNDFSGPKPIPQLGLAENATVEDIVSRLSSVNIDDYSENLLDCRSFYEVSPSSFESLSTSKVLYKLTHLIPEWTFSYYKNGQFFNNAICFLAGTEKKLWRYMVVIEDISRSSAWEITDSILPYIAGSLLSYGPSSAKLIVKESRKECTCSFSEKPIELRDKHKSILPSNDLSTVPQVPLDDRRICLRRVFHCKSVCKTLEKVPEELKLAVIATRCWLKNTDPKVDKSVVLALVCCLQTCLEKRGEAYCGMVQPLKHCHIHCLAQWECMWYMAITFNQILDYPFKYVSPGQLFSTTIFERFIDQSPDILQANLDEIGDLMFYVITNKIMEVPVPSSNAHLPQTQTISTQNKYSSLSS